MISAVMNLLASILSYSPNPLNFDSAGHQLIPYDPRGGFLLGSFAICSCCRLPCGVRFRESFADRICSERSDRYGPCVIRCCRGPRLRAVAAAIIVSIRAICISAGAGAGERYLEARTSKRSTGIGSPRTDTNGWSPIGANCGSNGSRDCRQVDIQMWWLRLKRGNGNRLMAIPGSILNGVAITGSGNFDPLRGLPGCSSGESILPCMARCTNLCGP